MDVVHRSGERLVFVDLNADAVRKTAFSMTRYFAFTVAENQSHRLRVLVQIAVVSGCDDVRQILNPHKHWVINKTADGEKATLRLFAPEPSYLGDQLPQGPLVVCEIACVKHLDTSGVVPVKRGCRARASR